MHWDVIEVIPEGDLRLKVRFRDGTEGRVRFERSHLNGVFTPLSDPKFFRQVYVEDGALTWPGDVDLAPDAMYAAVRTTGEWILK